MKNIFISVGLILALINVGMIWAQDQAETKVVEPVASDVVGADQERGVKIGVTIDDGKPLDKESLSKISEVVRAVAGDEAANEVLLEIEGMTDEEKAEVAEAISNGLHFSGEQIPSWVGSVAVIAVVLFLLTPLMILTAVFFYGARKRRQKMEIIQVYLDAGKDVPHQVLSTFDSSGGSFRSGLMYSAIGLGIIAAFNAAGEPSVGALGLIPLFVGIAKLLYWMFEERKYKNS